MITKHKNKANFFVDWRFTEDEERLDNKGYSNINLGMIACNILANKLFLFPPTPNK
jgi:hypothetical protein